MDVTFGPFVFDPTDTGKKRLDMVQGKVRALPEDGRVGPCKLDQSRPGDVLGQIARVRDADPGVVGAVQEQGRDADRGQHVADVQAVVGPDRFRRLT